MISKKVHVRDPKSGQIVMVRPHRVFYKGDLKTYEYDGKYYDATGKEIGSVPKELLGKTPRPYDPRPRSESVIRQEVLAESQAKMDELLAKEREKIRKEVQDEFLKDLDGKANAAPAAKPGTPQKGH